MIMNNTNSMCLLQNKYNSLCKLMRLSISDDYSNLNICIRDTLTGFISSHRRVAVYCYGEHTRMLFADFVAELRDIICIIDNGNVKNEGDFLIIKDDDIEEYELDGIIISSYRYREEIKQKIHDKHRSVDTLDLYEELQKHGVFLEHEFYFAGPYHIYSRINTLLSQIEKGGSIELFKQLLAEHVNIKDFRLACNLARKIYELTKDNNDREIYEKIIDLYESELMVLSQAGENNTLLFCLDGMRRRDFYTDEMKIYDLLKKSSYYYTNAYSYSTMTFESLVPVFEENTDQGTEYYLREEVASNECRFINKALDENRFIAIYGDGNYYIADNRIKYSGNSQTITEKIWDFIIDIDGVDNGVFYLHELYESHYSFVNPYTTNKLVSQGSAMLFDYLPQNSGKLRTDYKKQQKDALGYLDDTLAPFIEVLPCNLVLFADHGNLILDKDTSIQDITSPQLVAGEDWIRIPFVIKTKSMGVGQSDDLISLMELNDIMLSAMSGKPFVKNPTDHIKIGRSAIYNQQFRELYRLISKGYNGEAFEGFIFNDGYKLIVFSNGKKELYRTADDTLVDDSEMVETLFEHIKEEVSIL